MSDLGQWLFQKERETISRLLAQRAPHTAVVNAVNSGRVSVTDQLLAGTENQLLTVIGSVPLVGERVIIHTLADGERVAQQLGISNQRVNVKNTGTVIGDPRRLDFREGLLATAEDAQEVNISLDTTYADARYERTEGYIQGGRALYYTTYKPLGTLVNVTLTANRVYYVPIFCPSPTLLDSTLFDITTLVSGQVQMGLYSCSSLFLPADQLALGTKINYGALGFKNPSLSYTIQPGWYFVALCSVTAMGIRGIAPAAGLLPSPRGGTGAGNGLDSYLMAFQDLAGGWTNLPATASPSSGPANTYLHLGVRAA